MKIKILICGILPPPYFGHSMIYKILMGSDFVRPYDVTFFNMSFWSYGQHKKVNIVKLLKLIKYLFQYIFLILTKKPKYILYSISFDKMPFLKDVLFCGLGKILGCRIVLHDMGQYARVFYENSGPFYRRLFKWLIESTTAIIVLGENTKDVYSDLMARERIFVVSGSVEDSVNAMMSKIPHRRDEEQERSLKVLYFSFLSVSKGIWIALKSMPAVVKEYPSTHFVFAGPMESEALKQEIEQFVKDQKLESNFEYIGYVGDEVKRTECFRSADIFIFPTLRDVFGLVLLHAMAEGVPVVASSEGAIPEIVHDGETGFLFPKGNADQLARHILTYAGNPPLREKMGTAGRQRYLLNYTPQVYSQRMIRVFQLIEALR